MATVLPTKYCTTCKSFYPKKKTCKMTGADLTRTFIFACSWRKTYKVMRCTSPEYAKLPEQMKCWRAGVFVKLVKKLDKIEDYNIGDKIAVFVDDWLNYQDYKYMSYDELCLLRAHGYVGTPEIMELYPEEFEDVDPVILEFA